MPCTFCGNAKAEDEKSYIAEVKLWSGSHEGIPTGAAITLKPSTKIVCRNCGHTIFRLWQDEVQRVRGQGS